MDYTFLNLNTSNFGLDASTLQYYEMLFERAQAMSGDSFSQKVQGAQAVQFFQLSGLDGPTLSSIWNLASVFKQPFLVKQEFFLYLKYVALAQQGHFVAGNPLISY